MGYYYQQLTRLWEMVIAGIGLHLCVSVGGVFFFGFPVAYSLGAYAIGIGGREGLPLWASVAFAIVLASAIGAIFAFLYTRVSMDSFAVITLASVLANEALLKSWDSVTGGVLGVAGVARPGMLRTLFALMVFQGVIALLLLAGEAVLLQTPYGRRLRGLRENPSTLAVSGTSPQHIGIIVIVLASVLSGVAGIFAAWRIQFLDPSLGGVPLFIQWITVAILALRPQVRMLFLSAVFVVFLPEVLRFIAIPSTIVGHVRLLLYSALLMILLFRLNQLVPKQRIV